MKVPWAWFQRRFWEFRSADAQYLRYILSLTQWLIIFYSLYITKIGWLSAIFPSMQLFTALFIISYIPICILVGRYVHRKRQLKIEQEISLLTNPFLFKAQPGKERLVGLPMNLAVLESLETIVRKVGGWTPELEQQFEYVRRQIKTLRAGKTLRP